MDLREYDYITKSPDTFPRSTLLKIKKVLQDIDSLSTNLIDKVLENGYIEPPKEYEWHGCYKLALTDNEKSRVLDDLVRAGKELNDHSEYLGDEFAYVGQYVEYWTRAICETLVAYEEAIKNQSYYDLRGVSVVEFIKFLFDHDVPEDTEDPELWYDEYDMWIDYNKDELVDLYIRLFNDSADLLNRYSEEQLDQGCWVMMGPNLEVSLESIIWDDGIARAKRVMLIYSMYDMYNYFYKLNKLDTSCEMWWDSLAYDFYDNELRNRENKETQVIQDAMFSTLKKILEIDAKHCQTAALHGLGHLRHPDTEQAIKDYLRKHPGLDKNEKNYANACITGEIM